jgi:glycosyltransferase involved in cell wall biosynthesis
VVPKRANSFGNEAYSTKILEYMSQGVCVVVSKTRIDQFYFDDSVVRFFESGDERSLAEAILEVCHNKALRERLITNGFEYVARNSWDEKSRVYLNLVDVLIENTQRNHRRPPTDQTGEKLTNLKVISDSRAGP